MAWRARKWVMEDHKSCSLESKWVTIKWVMGKRETTSRVTTRIMEAKLSTQPGG